MTEEQIEAAARALYKVAGWDREWDLIYESARQRFRDAARAALEAAADADGEQARQHFVSIDPEAERTKNERANCLTHGLRAEIERLQAALLHYGHHKAGCPVDNVPYRKGPCVCGFGAFEQQVLCPECGANQSNNGWHRPGCSQSRL